MFSSFVKRTKQIESEISCCIYNIFFKNIICKVTTDTTRVKRIGKKLLWITICQEIGQSGWNGQISRNIPASKTESRRSRKPE